MVLKSGIMMDEETIQMLQNQIRAGDEAKRMLQALDDSRSQAGNASSSQQSLPSNNSIMHQFNISPPTTRFEEAQSQPSFFTQTPMQSHPHYTMYGATSASSTPVNRVQQSFVPYNPNIYPYGQGQQDMQTRTQVALTHPGQQNYVSHREDLSSPNDVRQQYTQQQWVKQYYRSQPLGQGQTSAMEHTTTTTTRHLSSVPWSGSQHRQYSRRPVGAANRAQSQTHVEQQQQEERRSEIQSSHGAISGAFPIQNTVTNPMALPVYKPTVSSHPSSSAGVSGRKNNEVVLTSASTKSSAEPSVSLPSSTAMNTAKSPPTMTTSSNRLPSSMGPPAVAGTQTGIPPASFDLNLFKPLFSQAERLAPGSSISIPNSKFEILKDHDSRMYLVSFDAKGGKTRLNIDSWKKKIQTASPQASVHTKARGGFQSGRAPHTMEQMGTYRPYGHPAQPETHLHKNFQVLTPLKKGQLTGYRPSPVPTELANNVESSNQTYSPRTPSQVDKKHLAEDILRALKPSALEKPWPKRPLPEDGSTAANSLQQRPAKRHAPEPGVEASSAVGLASTSTNQFSNAGRNDIVPPRVTAQPIIDNVSARGTLASSAVGLASTSTNQFSNAGRNDIVPPRVTAQPIIDNVSARGTLALVTLDQQYLPSTQPSMPELSASPPKLLVPLSQPHVQPSIQTSPSTTAQLPASILPPYVPSPSASTPTLLISQTSGQYPAEPFPSVPTSKTTLPAPQTVAQPSVPVPSSASEVKLNLTTSKTRIRPVVELPLFTFASTSALSTQKASTPLPRRKSPVRSDSVPAIATLPMTPIEVPATSVMSNNAVDRLSSASPRRSSPNNQQPEMRQKTPLFLPSPTYPPFREIKDETESTTVFQVGGPDHIMTDFNVVEPIKPRQPKDKNKERPQTQPYVLVPPRPTYLKLFKAKQLEDARRRNARIRPVLERHVSGLERSSSRLLEEPDVNYADPASFDFVKDKAEREAAVLSCSRISERPCKWNGCDVVMDSAEKLIKHFASEHRPRQTFKNLFVCQWQQCGKRLPDAKKLFIHLRSHATTPLLCGYKDCDESFRNLSQLVKHHEAEHRHDSPKPEATFFAPVLDPLPVAPQVLPSYMVEARQVQQPSISKERHASLVSWALKKIAGPTNLGVKRYNAAKPLQSADGAEERHGTQAYDFLAFPSVQYSSAPSQPSKIRNLDDLDSGEVSEMANDGMVLWYVPDIKEEETSSDEIPLHSNDQAGTLSDEEVMATMLTV